MLPINIVDINCQEKIHLHIIIASSCLFSWEFCLKLLRRRNIDHFRNW